MTEVCCKQYLHKAQKLLTAVFAIMIFSVSFISASYAEIYTRTDTNGVTYISVHPLEESNINEDHVVMYGASWCSHCAKARQYFKKNDIPFTEYDVEKKPGRMREFRDLGGNGYPLILIGQNMKMRGFSIEGFERRYYQ